MRRGTTLVMSAVTGAVLVAGLRAGAGSRLAATGAQPSGVVVLAPAGTPTGTPERRPAAHPTPRAKRPVVTSAPTTRATHKRAGTPPARTSTRTTPPTRSPKPSPARSTPTTSVVVNGRGVDTRYGLVQVQITISGHRITKAKAIAYPHGSGQTDEISSYAIPRLGSEALSAQSSHIDTVSGATYTSEGYRTSLQSALDAAHAAGAW